MCSIIDCDNNNYCKNLCRKHYNKKYREDNIEKSLAYNKLYRKLHLDKVNQYDKDYATTDKGRFIKARSKAKTRGLEFTITLEDFLEISKQKCYYCSDELCGLKNFQGAHLDRIDNSKGYVLGNIISCGGLCNRIRMSNLTVEETKDAIDGILAGRKRRCLNPSES